MFTSMFRSVFAHDESRMSLVIAPPNRVCFSLFFLSLFPSTFSVGPPCGGGPPFFSGKYPGFVLSLADHELGSRYAYPHTYSCPPHHRPDVGVAADVLNVCSWWPGRWVYYRIPSSSGSGVVSVRWARERHSALRRKYYHRAGDGVDELGALLGEVGQRRQRWVCM